MLKSYLKTLSEIDTGLINHKKHGNIILNKIIFPDGIPSDLISYKIEFINKLENKEKLLTNLKNKLKKDKISKYKNIVLNEIKIKLEKINFLKEVYDIEANKLSLDYNIEKKKIDYERYNLLFFGLSKKDIRGDSKIEKWTGKKRFIKKENLLELIKYSEKLCNKIKFRIGNYTNLSHTKGTINIPDQEEYSMQTVITLFFHETTHFFRYINGIRNLGFNYDFSDYNDLEEGFAIYNEYKYGNLITNYGVYNPYYDLCYNTLLKNIPKENKIKEIHLILKQKGYNKEKSLNYYHRFYRYSEEGGNKLFLKDLIYTKGYDNVIELLNKDLKNYDKIFAGKIGIFELKKKLIEPKRNFNTKAYFENMVKKIQTI